MKKTCIASVLALGMVFSAQAKDIVDTWLNESFEGGRHEGRIGKILNFLGQYAVMHFGKEEACMEEHRCPAASANKLAHVQFIELFTSMQKRFTVEGPTTALAVDLQQQTSAWLVNHILRVDTKLRSCAKAKLPA